MLLKLLLNRSFRPLSTKASKVFFKPHIPEDIKKNQEQKILTIPNVLTMCRVAVTPTIGYFICNGMYKPALTCFAFAAATDLLDGLIARTFNQKSDLGTILDPIADKFLLTTCFISLYYSGLLPFWVTKAFIFRDVLIITGGVAIRYFSFPEWPGLKKFTDFNGHPTIGFEPTFVSKCNTALQCSVILTHLSTRHLLEYPNYDNYVYALHLLTFVTTLASFTQYAYRFCIIHRTESMNMPKRK